MNWRKSLEDFELLEEYGHEQVIYCSNKESGLKAIIANHDTILGPALGGKINCGMKINTGIN